MFIEQKNDFIINNIQKENMIFHVIFQIDKNIPIIMGRVFELKKEM